MKNWKLICFTTISLFLFTLGMIGSAQAGATLTWTSGSLGGQWYSQAGGIARLITEKNPDIILKVVPGGGVANAARVSKGRNDIGWGITFVDKMALNGVKPLFKTQMPGLRSIGGIFGKYQVHMLVGKKTGIETVQELADMVKNNKPVKIAVPLRGVSDLNVVEYILDYYGISLDAITSAGGKIFYASYSDMVNLYKDHHVDIACTMQSSPSATMTEMTLSRKSNLLSVSEDCVNTLNKKVGTLPKDSGFCAIEKDLYHGIEKEILTIVSASELLVNKNVPEEIVYEITKIICENIKQLHKDIPATQTFIPEKSWMTVAVPLHPGAEKYYKEAGYIK